MKLADVVPYFVKTGAAEAKIFRDRFPLLPRKLIQMLFHHLGRQRQPPLIPLYLQQQAFPQASCPHSGGVKRLKPGQRLLRLRQLQAKLSGDLFEAKRQIAVFVQISGHISRSPEDPRRERQQPELAQQLGLQRRLGLGRKGNRIHGQAAPVSAPEGGCGRGSLEVQNRIVRCQLLHIPFQLACRQHEHMDGLLDLRRYGQLEALLLIQLQPRHRSLPFQAKAYQSTIHISIIIQAHAKQLSQPLGEKSFALRGKAISPGCGRDR